jgi:uncharacterized protein (DUF362 family)
MNKTQKSYKRIGRRRFIRQSLITGTLMLGSSFEGFQIFADSTKRSRVIQLQRPGLLEGAPIPAVRKLTAGQVVPLVEESLCALTGKNDLTEAWLSLVSRKDVIGIKVNTLAGPGLSTQPALAVAVAKSLEKAGIPPGNIILWDRLNRELKRAGYHLSSKEGQVRCLGSDSLPLPYEKNIEHAGSVGSCFATLVTRYCTALINLPILKDHDLSGVSLGMKNWYGAIHNPNKYHDNNCNPYIADLSTHPDFRKKIRLTLVDGLIGQYHGGPSLKPRFVFPFEGLLASTDPVAVDRLGAEIIEKQREVHGHKTLKEEGRPPVYIETAARLGLGTDQPDKMEVKEV